MASRLAYLVTEDWYFLQHRLPMARAARSAGYDVHVLTRVSQRGAEIEREGFALHPLSWKRRASGPIATAAAVAEVRRKLRQIRPEILHNVALKPSIIGSLACVGLAAGPEIVSSVNGLGSGFLAGSLRGRVKGRALEVALGALLNRPRTHVIVQNPDDSRAIYGIGVQSSKIRLIPGSGVDVDWLRPLPEPAPPPIRYAFVGRMLEDKGVRTLIAGHRLLRSRGYVWELVLAGLPDPENSSSISQKELASWGAESGVTWLGHVPDIRTIWSRCHVAVLMSRREGLPMSLLEAAACGRPMVASDVPGCREVVKEGETGLLVPVDNPRALCDALERLAKDAEMRRRMGAAARELAVARFSATDIGRQTVELYRALTRRPAGQPRPEPVFALRRRDSGD